MTIKHIQFNEGTYSITFEENGSSYVLDGKLFLQNNNTEDIEELFRNKNILSEEINDKFYFKDSDSSLIVIPKMEECLPEDKQFMVGTIRLYTMYHCDGTDTLLFKITYSDKEIDANDFIFALFDYLNLN